MQKEVLVSSVWWRSPEYTRSQHWLAESEGLGINGTETGLSSVADTSDGKDSVKPVEATKRGPTTSSAALPSWGHSEEAMLG